MNEKLLKLVKDLSLKDKKTLSQKALKVSEETGELAKVVLPYDSASGTLHRFVDKTKILDEVADVMLSAISIAYDLEFTDEEIEDKLYQKSLYWMGLQAKESKVEFPLPFETHITIKRPDDIQDFINACDDYTSTYDNRLKPIVLDLQNGGKSVMTDVMTSSKHMGDNRSAQMDAEQIVNFLKSCGFEVLRTKIESVPWHPAAPIDSDEKFFMPEDCYFESHIGIVASDGTVDKLREISYNNNCHLSKNAFKKIDKDSYIIMATYRSTDQTYETFLKSVENIKSDLSKNGFVYEKVIVEFSVYDTKVKHDSEWLV
jgi:NTP pyrophosphatase (non-canonical NTP hydrolase)